MPKNLSARFYQKYRKGHERYRNLSKEDKNKKRQFTCKWYKNIPEDEKQSLVEYRKNYSKTWKIRTVSQMKTDWCFLATQDFF